MKMSEIPSVKFVNATTTIPSFNSQTSSVLSSVTPNVPKPMVQFAPSVPLSSTPMASASLTGLVSPDAQVISTSSPVYVHQTVNAPIVPITPLTPSRTNAQIATQGVIGQSRLSPNMPTFVSSTGSKSSTFTIGKASPSQNSPSITRLETIGSMASSVQSLPPAVSGINFPKSSPKIIIEETITKMLPEVEIDEGFEVTNYQGIMKSNIENELLNAGYAPLSRIIVKASNGSKRTHYIKAINKKGQKLFILIDTQGYTSARATDLTLIEANTASIVPYSVKTGAYNCAGKDVCGVAFECGIDGVCILSRGVDDLTPKEANFVLVEQSVPSAASIEVEGNIMTYPVVRLSEIRVNPDEILKRTDLVTRRLRNTAYTMELRTLEMERRSLTKLKSSFDNFELVTKTITTDLNNTLRQLETWNDVYMSNPPTTDEFKAKYRLLQENLTQRNEDVSTLLKVMAKVASKYQEIDVITAEIQAMVEFLKKEFANVKYAIV